MSSVNKLAAGAGRILAVAVLLCCAALIDSDYYAPQNGKTAQPKPVPGGDGPTERRDQLKFEITSALVKNRLASVEALTAFYGLDERTSIPCSVHETFGAAASDPQLAAKQPLNEGEPVVLCLN